MGLLIDHINVCLSKLRADPVTELSTDASSEAYKAQIAVNRAVRRIWNHKQWTFKRKSKTFSTVADQADYALDKSIAQPYAVLSSASPYRLRLISRFNLDKADPQRNMEGDPRIAAVSEMTGVENQPSSASVIGVFSSSTSDTTQKVLIKGIVNGEEDYEQVSLNGTTEVFTTKSFTSVLWVTKSAVSVGRVTVRIGATTLVTVGALEKTVYLRLLSLYPIPQSVLTITVRYFGKAPFMTHAYETSGIPDDWDYVVDQWAFLLALQAKGQDQSTEFANQVGLGTKFLEEDMKSEELDSSDDPLIIQAAGESDIDPEARWAPSGHGYMER